MTIDFIEDDLIVGDGVIVFNGVNGATGEPITKSLSELAGFVKTESKTHEVRNG
jgi:hypothetical protein